MKKRLIKISAIVLTAAVVAGGAGGVSAFACNMCDDSCDCHAPGEAKTVDPTIVTATAHRAASPLPDMLGANVPSGFGMINGGTVNASNACNNFALEVWGSDLNSQPDPYWWNYYYNFNGGNAPTSDVLLNANGQGSPVKADTITVSSTYGGVSASLYRRPNVLIGVDSSNSYTGSYDGYDEQLGDIAEAGETYSPELARYNPTYLSNMIDTVYEAADAIEATNKSTRYSETPSEIAEEYENYILGIRGYIEDQIGSAHYKRIAIVSGVSTSGGVNTYTIVGPGAPGANSTNRYVEYTDDYTINITNAESTTISSAALVDSTSGAEAIIITTDAVEEAIKQDTTITGATNAPELISVNELDTLYGVYMNSVENALGMGYILGRIYDQDDASGFLSAQNLYMYFAEKFYHIKDTELNTILEKGTEKKMKEYNASENSNPLIVTQNIGEMSHIISDVDSDAAYYEYAVDDISDALAQYASN